MKIQYAIFENITYILSGLGRTSLKLDFKDMPNIINVFIGDSGTGKTAILGMLHPWADFGNLDERNSLPLICEGKDGKKILSYIANNTEYIVKHIWTWKNDKHFLKSFFSKNGVELNPNGNQSSFKEMVEIEFGIDQSFLKLLRIGPNVANMISLSSTERKEFVAKMLSITEIYLMILKDMNEKYRTLNAQSSLLSKRIGTVTDADIANLHNRVNVLDTMIFNNTNKRESIKEKITKLSSENEFILNRMSTSKFESMIDVHRAKLSKLTAEYDELHTKIEDISNEYGSDKMVSREIGKCDSDIINNTRLIKALETEIINMTEKSEKINRIIRISGDISTIELLKSTYDNYTLEIDNLSSELKNFECQYTSTELKMLFADLQNADTALFDLLTYDRELLRYVIQHETTAVSYAKSQIERLQYKIIKTQRSLNNSSFIIDYSIDDADLVLPPECKCRDKCPYYKTHPTTVKKSVKPNELKEERKTLTSQIETLNNKIDGFVLVPTMCNMVRKARSLYNELSPKLKNIGALRTYAFYDIIMDSTKRSWYDNDKICILLEKCDMRERLHIMQSKVIELQNELSKYDNSESELSSMIEESNELSERIRITKRKVLEVEEENKKINNEKKTLENTLEFLFDIEAMKIKLKDIERDKNDTYNQLDKMNDSIIKARQNDTKIISLADEMSTLIDSYSSMKNEYDSLEMNLRELESNRREFNAINEKINTLNLLRQASTPTDGIPLIYVRLFLDDCVDTINDIVNMIYDDIEVLPFEIDGTFEIPYRKGNRIIRDISAASQGERALISMALSFALMRKTILAFNRGVVMYNIPLIDEVDSAFYSAGREKFLSIVLQQFKVIEVEQSFIITHNNCYEGYPINIIKTSPENVNGDYPTINLYK